MTLAAYASFEQTIKRSKFVAVAAPVASAAAAQDFIAAAADPRATHNAFAWRLACDGSSRSHGDGEPAGTAGPPILGALAAADLHDVAVLVTRYYGGVQLAEDRDWLVQHVFMHLTAVEPAHVDGVAACDDGPLATVDVVAGDALGAGGVRIGVALARIARLPLHVPGVAAGGAKGRRR